MQNARPQNGTGAYRRTIYQGLVCGLAFPLSTGAGFIRPTCFLPKWRDSMYMVPSLRIFPIGSPQLGWRGSLQRMIFTACRVPAVPLAILDSSRCITAGSLAGLPGTYRRRRTYIG